MKYSCKQRRQEYNGWRCNIASSRMCLWRRRVQHKRCSRHAAKRILFLSSAQRPANELEERKLNCLSRHHHQQQVLLVLKMQQQQVMFIIGHGSADDTRAHYRRLCRARLQPEPSLDASTSFQPNIKSCNQNKIYS